METVEVFNPNNRGNDVPEPRVGVGVVGIACGGICVGGLCGILCHS